jgi:hypothetical protein
MSAAPGSSTLPQSTDSGDVRRLLDARAHVLGCTPAVARELTRLKHSEQDLWEKIAGLERLVGTLTTLVIGKGKATK